LAGLRLGRGGVRVGAGRALGLGPGRKGYVLFFFEIISSAKQIQEKPKKCVKAQKISRKFQKLQENAQR
jgi:hypothetical protein